MSKQNGDGIRKHRLVDWCTRLRSHLLYSGQATESELSAVWPADCGCTRKPQACDECREASTWEWVRTHGHLRYMQGHAAARPGEESVAERELMKAAADQPETLTVWSAEEDGQPVERRIAVWPKSTAALMWFADRDWTTQWLQARREVLRQAMVEGSLDRGATPKPRALLEQAGQEIAHQLAVLTYAATWEGVGLDREAVSDPPAFFRNMDVLTQARIHAEFRNVNVGRVMLTEHLVRPRKDDDQGGRMSWNVFGARYSTRMKIPPREYMENVSLPSALAQIRLSGAPSMDEQMEEAVDA